jgi:hypothetical protein
MVYEVMQNHFPSHLPDDELTLEVERLARCAREATAGLVAHLAEFDARRLYRGAGYPSLFAYCTQRLRISEYGAYNRMEAARAARRFPVILRMLSDGSLNLATVRVLAPHLTSENHRELLESASGRSKREVEELVVRHFPRSAVPTLVRKLPSRIGSPVPAAAPAQPPVEEALPRVDGSMARPRPAEEPSAASPQAEHVAGSRLPLLPSAGAAITPLAPERYQIRFTASAETYRKLRQAQELLGHGVPSGDVAAIVDRALSALLADLTRKKLAATERPRAARPTTAGSRHVPAQVRRDVWRRDGGQCAFVAGSGLRCSARKALEFHHVHPYAVGGDASVGNIELRCRNHNAFEAEVFYGATAQDSPRGEFGRANGVP